MNGMDYFVEYDMIIIIFSLKGIVFLKYSPRFPLGFTAIGILKYLSSTSTPHKERTKLY